MRKSTPPFVKHNEHPIEILASDKHNGAYYHCQKCRVFVGWLSKLEFARAQELGLIQNESKIAQN
jgi:hypothetical protein